MLRCRMTDFYGEFYDNRLECPVDIRLGHYHIALFVAIDFVRCSPAD